MRFVTTTALLLALLLLNGCTSEPAAPTATASSNTQVPAPTTVASAECPAIVLQALTAVDSACRETGRNQICYGNVQLSAEFREGSGAISFQQPGDIASLNDVRKIELSPLNASAKQWGVALMQVQANLPDSLPGQNVTFLLFGDVEIENVTEGDIASRGFYFRTGIGDSSCSEAPDSGILIQTPAGVSEVALRMNGVDITLGSTAYLQAQPDRGLRVNVLEGRAAVTAQGETEVVTAGNRTSIPLTADLNPAGPPSSSEPYDGNNLQNLPVNNLQRQISVASVLISSDFVNDSEGWETGSADLAAEYLPANESSDGAVCSANAVLAAPSGWLGDRSDAFNGAISVIAPGNSQAALEVRLEGAGISLMTPLPPRQTRDWLVYSVQLDDSSGWINVSSASPASADDLRTALADITALQVRHIDTQAANPICMDYIQLTAGIVSASVYQRPADFIPTLVAALGPEESFEISIGAVISVDLLPGMGEIESPGSSDIYTFTSEGTQSVYFAAGGESGPLVWSLAAPDGTLLFENSRLWDSNDPGVFALDQPGPYTITVTGEAGSTGTYGFSLSSVGESGTYMIEPDVRVYEDFPASGAGRIETPAANDFYTFTLAEPLELYFSALGEETRAKWSLTAPSGQLLFEDMRLWQGNHPGAFTLEAGTYSLTVAGEGDSVGTYQFAVWIIPPPQTFDVPLGTVVSDGIPQPGMGRIESPGARDIYTLALTEPASVTFSALGEDGRSAWSLAASDGTFLFSDQRLWQGNHPGTFALEPGTYTITVRGDLGDSGTYRFSITPLDTPTSINLDNAKALEVSASIETAGEQQQYVFEARVNQTIFIEIPASEPSTLWVLTDAQGNELFSTYRSGMTTIGPILLEQAGQHTLTVSGYADETGPYEFTIWNVAEPDTFAIAIGDIIARDFMRDGAGQIETPGVQDIYTFSATPGQQIFVEVLEAEFSAYWALVDAEGTQVFGSYRSGGSSFGVLTLERGGLYTLTVSGYLSETGVYRARIWDVPEPDAFSIGLDDTIAAETTGEGAGQIESPGVRDLYTFTAEPGQKIFIQVIESELTLLCQLTDQAGTSLFNSYRNTGSDLGVVTLEAGGTYTLSISGYDKEIGAYRMRTWFVPEPDRYEVQIGDSVAEEVTGVGAGHIETPGVRDIYTFTAEAGQTITIDLTMSPNTLLWELTDPDGTSVLNSYRSGDSLVWNGPLAAAGTYTLAVSGYAGETGIYRFRIVGE